VTTAVDIANRALLALGAKTISAINEDSVAGRACNRVYEPLRDAELRAHPWGFAKKRVSLAASATAPPFGYENAFPLPTDFLRLAADQSDKASQDGVVPIDWNIEGRSILTDDEAPFNLVYIAKIDNANLFDALFVEALAARIAMSLAEKLTQSNSKRELAKKEYEAAIKEARRINSIERIPQELPEDGWITARRG